MIQRTVLGLALLTLLALPAPAQVRNIKLRDRERTTLNDLANTTPGFMLQVTADRKDRVYAEGEEFSITVKPERDCYVHVINIGPTGDVTLLFPNEDQSDPFVPARKEVVLPDPNRRFGFVVERPLGEETVLVIATTTKINLRDQKDIERFSAQALGSKKVEEQHEGLKNIVGRVRRHVPPEGWVMQFIQVRTVEKDAPRAVRGPRKWLVCVGIADYEDAKIDRLNVPHKDAKTFAETLTTHSGYELVGEVLINEKATRANVAKLLREQLPAVVQPDDTVCIFWSGHGGRMADTSGDEEDQLDEYLYLYDTKELKPDTVLLDDTFFSYMSKLDRCKVVFVLDCCYAAGTPKGTTTDGRPFDMFDGEMRRSKDLGGHRQVLLAASAADERSWELANSKLSVMTHFLVESIKKHPRLSVEDAYHLIKADVTTYVKDNLGKVQTPALEGEEAKNTYLRGGE
jgi:hypothetical protein